MNDKKPLSEYIFGCGCTSIWNPNTCPVHDEPCIIESSQVDTQRKVRKITEDFTVYNCHVYTYLESKSKKKLKSLLIERPGLFIIDWMEEQIKQGQIKRFVILDTKARNLYGKIEYDRRLELEGMFVYIFNVDKDFKNIADVLTWNYTTYLNCSIGEAVKHAHGNIHTAYQSTYRYLTNPRFRDVVRGTEAAPSRKHINE